MAEKVQRIVRDNLFISNTSISASTYDLSMPPENILDPLTSVRWRSASGWNPELEFGDRLLFAENGNEVAAGIPPGHYASRGDYMAAVQAAMNDASILFNTYELTEDSNGGITIARASGTAAFELRFRNTDLYYRRSAHPDLGFDDGLKTGSTSYVSDRESVVAGRAYLLFDLSTYVFFGTLPATVNFVGVAGTNLGEDLQAGDLTLYGNDDVVNMRPWFNPDTVVPILNSAGDRYDGQGVDFTSNTTKQFYALVLNPNRAGAGYSEAGVVWLGSYYQPARAFSQGYNEFVLDPSLVTVGDSGAVFQDSRLTSRGFSGMFRRLDRADKEQLRLFYQAVRKGGHYWLAMDPLNFPQSETIYGTLSTSFSSDHRAGGGTGATRFDVPLGIIEEVG